MCCYHVKVHATGIAVEWVYKPVSITLIILVLLIKDLQLCIYNMIHSSTTVTSLVLCSLKTLSPWVICKLHISLSAAIPTLQHNPSAPYLVETFLTPSLSQTFGDLLGNLSGKTYQWSSWIIAGPCNKKESEISSVLITSSHVIWLTFFSVTWWQCDTKAVGRGHRHLSTSDSMDSELMNSTLTAESDEEDEDEDEVSYLSRSTGYIRQVWPTFN